MLAWYFAARHTAIDCLKNRNKPGFLFTIGDEPVLNGLASRDLQEIMGPGQYQDVTSRELLESAREKYHVFHINISETARGSQPETVDSWKALIGDDLLPAQRHTDVAGTIASTILANYGKTTRRSSATDPSDGEEIL